MPHQNPSANPSPGGGTARAASTPPGGRSRAPFRVLDLFAGIGGFSLGLERTGGFETVAFCEIEPFCRRVLAKHWPDVPCYDDVRTLTAERLAADGIAVDVISGGFPCQDISSAGPRTGINGERSGLWYQYSRLICEVRPRFVIVENSSDVLARGMGEIVGFLAQVGYNAFWDCIPAAAVGAQVLRDRAYIIAVSHQIDGLAGMDIHSELKRTIPETGHRLRSQFRAMPACPSIREDAWVSKGLDQTKRRESLGNSVVPQIPEILGRAILAAEAGRAA